MDLDRLIGVVSSIIAERSMEGDESWRRPNRRFGQLAPHYEFEEGPNAFIVIDLVNIEDRDVVLRLYRGILEEVEYTCWQGGCNIYTILLPDTTLVRDSGDGEVIGRIIKSQPSTPQITIHTIRDLVEKILEEAESSDILIFISNNRLLSIDYETIYSMLSKLDYISYRIFVSIGDKPRDLDRSGWMVLSLD